jgi:hypothetical protein
MEPIPPWKMRSKLFENKLSLSVHDESADAEGLAKLLFSEAAPEF